MQWFFDKAVRMLSNEDGFAGPKDDDEEDDVIIGDDEDDDDDDDVEIDLDEDDDDEDDNKPGNKAFAAMRVENKELKQTVDKLNQSVEDLKTAAPAAAPYVAPIAADPNDPRKWTEDQWDALAKTDWKKAVDMRSKMQAEDQISQSSQTTEFNRVMEESKTSVLTRHPELNDPNSEKAKVYRNIVTANPEYTNQKKGPLSAMYEMEDYMEKNMGYKREDIVKAELNARADESARHSRVQLTSTTGHNLSGGNKIIISKDEMDFCKLQGIDPKVYATNKKKLESAGKGGVQL